MAGLDTNVLVRWLVADDDTQADQAQRLFDAATVADEPLFVPATVSLELEWVLRSRYRLDKETVIAAFNALLETRGLELESESAIERALHAHRNGSVEFADCLHAGLCQAADRAPMFTFDAKAARVTGAALVPG
ncbi:MAG: twitching motility protein PilT [Methylibium sp. NZG]|nr:MAG: twitching motility protein PilT [Methylibium sp. NZG]